MFLMTKTFFLGESGHLKLCLCYRTKNDLFLTLTKFLFCFVSGSNQTISTALSQQKMQNENSRNVLIKGPIFRIKKEPLAEMNSNIILNYILIGNIT